MIPAFWPANLLFATYLIKCCVSQVHRDVHSFHDNPQDLSLENEIRHHLRPRWHLRSLKCHSVSRDTDELQQIQPEPAQDSNTSYRHQNYSKWHGPARRVVRRRASGTPDVHKRRLHVSHDNGHGAAVATTRPDVPGPAEPDGRGVGSRRQAVRSAVAHPGPSYPIQHSLLSPQNPTGIR